MNPYLFTEKYHYKLPTQDDYPSLESLQTFPPEGSCKISVNKNQNKNNQPALLSLPGYNVNQTQIKITAKNTWKKTGKFLCEDKIISY